ncbi:MAG: glycosyl transferase family protein [Geminicoccaceae bacterium]|nr:glycosyl transferase family protein [Geminicoccaceae bacterium]
MTDLVYRAGEPFAQALRIIGRGPTLSRPLAVEEAEAAMAAILDGGVDELQLGAFLLALRTRGESASELAGFLRAARARLPDLSGLAVDLDWPSCADAHKQLPWFLLAVRLVASAGVRVLLHGVAGEGPLGTRAGLAALGLPVARGFEEAARALDRVGLAYLPLELFAPRLSELVTLKPRLGVRTVINSLVRGLDPARARARIVGVFHPPYVQLHAEAERMLGATRCAVFKGAGGEAQRNPDKPCRVLAVEGTEIREELWPALLPEDRYPWRSEPSATSRLRELWEGALAAPAPVAAVTGTAAIALRLAGRARTMEEAQALAERLWRDRPRLDLAA